MTFFDSHWGHLLTKPLESGALFLGVRLLHGSPALACWVALAVPALVSGIRKEILWPGSMRTAAGWKDLAADTLAALVLIAPLTLLAGLHRWALP
jgi:hypothetical protein